MIQEQLWSKRSRRTPRIHQPRFGEMLQIGGSLHDWFEGRGRPCTLIAFIDDATSAVTEWRFCEAETTFNHFACLKRHLHRYGRPASVYSDRHGIFRVNAREQWQPHKKTQFARAPGQLEIRLICARTPQAKGRIERLFQTVQDRLVRELRLQGVSTIEQANAFID